MAGFSVYSSMIFILFAICCKMTKFSLAQYYYPPLCPAEVPIGRERVLPRKDIDLIEFGLNLEFLQAAFWLNGATGAGLEAYAPELVEGGPQPIGAQRANLDNLTRNIFTEFGFEEVGRIRAIKSTVRGFPRPLLDISAQNFARFFDEAFGYRLNPPFNPYRDSLHFMLGSYLIPYVTLTYYVYAIPRLEAFTSKSLVAGLLGVTAGQDAVIRTYLYERAFVRVFPYKYTVLEFTIAISNLRNRLGMCGIKDEPLFVPPALGAEGRTSSNILSANNNSLSFERSPEEVLRIEYDTGNEHIPGGFFPGGANGTIARELLEKPY